MTNSKLYLFFQCNSGTETKNKTDKGITKPKKLAKLKCNWCDCDSFVTKYHLREHETKCKVLVNNGKSCEKVRKPLIFIKYKHGTISKYLHTSILPKCKLSSEESDDTIDKECIYCQKNIKRLSEYTKHVTQCKLKQKVNKYILL